MAHRKEVFQSKVLQKLYPAAPKVEREPSPPRIVDALSRKTHVKRNTIQQDAAIGGAGTTQCAANQGRRMYTVQPPPADYKTDSEKSVTLPQLQSMNSAEDPVEERVHDSNEELDGEKEEEEWKRKRKRRKRKLIPHQDSGKDGAAPVCESSAGQIQTPVDEGGERISRNKKRKLKKKRHKHKLLDMGLMPRATALEFTYRKDEEEEDNKRRAAQQLYSFKAFVQQQQTEELEKALEELFNTSPMSVEEITAVISLCQYWITDIVFPMQGDKKTGLSTMHPQDSESH